MLISKFNLCKVEWLDLVFEDRNKAYGAYELRQNYAGNMVKAMGFAFSGIALLCAASIVFGTTVAHRDRAIVVNILPPVVIQPQRVQPPKHTEPPAPKPLKAQPPAPQVATTKFVVMVPTSKPIVENPPTIDELEGKAVGTETTTGKTGIANVTKTGDDGPPTPPADNTIHLGADIMPEPIGGEAAWSKFLNKNLRFPPQAEESGKVILSFVVEKDGQLSNITVVRSAGDAYDAEAIRVLKLAKPWKPGQQNGQAVRVKYTIPINFQVADGN